MPAAIDDLTSGILPGSGLQHLAHDDRVDQVRIDRALSQRSPDGGRPQIDGGQRRQRPEQLALRGACGGDNDHFRPAHDASSTIRGASVAAWTSSTLTSGRELHQHQPAWGDVNHREVRDDPVDHPLPVSGNEQVVDDLGRTVARHVLHEH